MFPQLNMTKTMPRVSRLPSVRTLAIVGGICAVALLGLWARYRFIAAPTKLPPATTSQPTHAGGASRSVGRNLKDTDILSTTLSPSGFSPRELNHAPGVINLKVKNQSGQDEIVLRVTNANGDVIAEARVTNKVNAWSTPLQLSPGLYTLREANHNDWTCQIQITD